MQAATQMSVLKMPARINKQILYYKTWKGNSGNTIFKGGKQNASFIKLSDKQF